MRIARFAMPVVFAVVAWSMFQGCSSEQTPGKTTAGRTTGSGGSGTGGATSGGAGGAGATGGSTTTTGTGGTLPPIEPPKDVKSDIVCVTSCDQPGGQYCERIGDNCGMRLE